MSDQSVQPQRRRLVGAALAAAGASSFLAGCATEQQAPAVVTRKLGRVLVVGGGYGGATAAKYLKKWGGDAIDVMLVERERAFVSCPLSNLVLGGHRKIEDLTMSYDGLRRAGILTMNDEVLSIDAAKRTVAFQKLATQTFDRIVVAPGIDFNFGAVQGLNADAQKRILHAWKAGPQTVELRRQLEAMPDGGVFAITIPEAPYRCPPGPYERASVVAGYLKANKPRSKVLILDANQDVTSKGPLFKRVWNEQYKGILEYRAQHKVTAVDAKAGVIKFDVQEDVKAQVLNVLPPMRAGAIAVQTGLNNLGSNRWCGVNYLNFESTVAKDVHVLGDSIQIAPAMPKSGHMANSHGKVAAAAIVAELSGWPINPAPMLTNTCYSFIDPKMAIHVASVHEYVAAEKTFKTVAGSGGVSTGPTELEGVYALSWASNIWADSLS